MGDNLKLSVTKLIVDGSNWVMYCDCMLWAVGSCNLAMHLTEATITQEYLDAGNVGILMPQLCWDLDQRIVKQLISTSVPNSVFNNIKTGATAKDVWDELKKQYEGCTTLILVDLRRQLQMMHLSRHVQIFISLLLFITCTFTVGHMTDALYLRT